MTHITDTHLATLRIFVKNISLDNSERREKKNVKGKGL